MKESLDIQQAQRLAQRLSPRQVLHVRVLEMTQPELEEELRRQLDDNPALEVKYSEDAEDSNSSTALAEPGEVEIDVDDDPADYYPSASRAEDWDYLYNRSAETPDLYESLAAQARLLDLPPSLSEKVTYLIGNLDESGYMSRTISALSQDYAIDRGEDPDDDEMRQAFEVLRGFDPAGVGAVDLRDCLLIQLNRMGKETDSERMAIEIVKDYFDLLSKKHYERLASALGVDSTDDLVPAMNIIRGLNPKPGSAIQQSASMQRLAHITPDVAVEQEEDGRFTVSVLNRLPQLQIEHSFTLDLPSESIASRGGKEAQAFIKSKRDEAEAFISALKNRSQSLLMVTEAIVRRQSEFFATGDSSKLRPMVLKDVSTDTGLDLSAISRTTAGKYLAAPTGLYPLKMFFNEAPSDNSDTSSHEMLGVIREIIEGESPQHPLSDQAILDEMERRGYSLARRTITKYREKLGLPVARLRKKL